MARSPYPGFTRLNGRRGKLIDKKFTVGLTEIEEREFKMLQGVVGLMIDYRYPMEIHPDLLEALKQVERREKSIREGNE